MKTDEILARPPKVLSQAQRAHYFAYGYLLLEGFVDDDWLARLWETTEAYIERSRALTRADQVFDLEPDHRADAPRLRRITHPVEVDEQFRRFTLEGPLVDLAEDLLGPDVKFHHSKLNFKWHGGGEEVKWHQDIPFWPHTNYSPLTIGVYLADVDDEMGPMGVVPGSHDGPIYDHYDAKGNWTGALAEADVATLELSRVAWLRGRRGSVTIHNCRTVHGSAVNRSPRMRPLLLQTYAAADAFHLTSLVDRAPHSNTIIRGRPSRWIDFDPRPCIMPPDWSQGYTSIFAVQQALD